MKTTISYFIKFNLGIILLMALIVNSFAQSTNDFHPIEIKRSLFSTKYFYNGQSFKSPFGLQIPLMEVNDSQVTKDFMVFEKSRNTAKIVNLISTGISLYAFFNRKIVSDGTYWAALGTVGAISAYFNVRSGIHLDRALRRYNKIASGAELGFQYDNTYNGNGILSVGISHKFK